MKTPDAKSARHALIGSFGPIGLAIFLTIALAAEARASEIGSDLADRSVAASLVEIASADLASTDSAATGFSTVDTYGANSFAPSWLRDVQNLLPGSPLSADAAQSSDEASTAAADHDAGDGETLGVSSLALWLPAAAQLPYGDAGLVDTFVLAIGALHSSDAVQAVCDTLWELQDLEGSTHALVRRPLDIDLREHDSYAAAEVAFVLGNVPAPEPDVVFLAFVVLQSLWGLASQPRRT
ncbi:MAG TPA: hypothetical protein VHY91_10510 [Pirellulales bacterium]|jgi:hypothetical protein|nr:hypothetical protein [Pirellulales bacterium]